MQAFHGDVKIQKKYLARVAAHREADELIQRHVGEDGKGCAVWCTLDKYDHRAYEAELGIPEWLARVEDCIFEGLDEKKAQQWPEAFLKAIKPGADLEKVKTPFLIFILESTLESMAAVKFDVEKFPDVKLALHQSREAVQMMIEAHKKQDEAARSAAWSAAQSAVSAARSAVWSAANAMDSAAQSAANAMDSAAQSAVSAAQSAVWSAANAMDSAAQSAVSAVSAAQSAVSAARSAVWSAANAMDSAARSAANAMDSAAQSAAYERFAEKLLQLIEGCN